MGNLHVKELWTHGKNPTALRYRVQTWVVFCRHTRLHHPRMVNEMDILLHLSGSYLSLGIGAEHVTDVLFQYCICRSGLDNFLDKLSVMIGYLYLLIGI